MFFFSLFPCQTAAVLQILKYIFTRLDWCLTVCYGNGGVLVLNRKRRTKAVCSVPGSTFCVPNITECREDRKQNDSSCSYQTD